MYMIEANPISNCQRYNIVLNCYETTMDCKKKKEKGGAVAFGVSFISCVCRLPRHHINDPTSSLDDRNGDTSTHEDQISDDGNQRSSEKKKMGFNFKSPARISRVFESRKVGFVAILTCLLVPALFFMVHEHGLSSTDIGITKESNLENKQISNSSSTLVKLQVPPINDGSATTFHKDKNTNKPMCDTTSYERTNVCELTGEIRIHGKSSSVVYITSSDSMESQEYSWSIKPYPRKRDKRAMGHVRDVILNRSSTSQAPVCNVNHTVPGIVFSGGGYAGNIYHDITDILVPLFLTSYRYSGEVKLIITDMNSWWNKKYKVVLEKLTRYKIINFDRDDRIHCFRQVTVGILRHKEFGIDPSRTPGGIPSMADFGKLMRTGFSLKRDRVIGLISGHKPRILIVLRKRTRRLLNADEIIKMSEEIGYEVVAEEAAGTKEFASLANSCDVMLGVHGAGLTNMVFLPTNATLVQIVPWGGLEGVARYCYGDVTAELGLRYVEYSIGEEESSLVEMYPRDDVVFKDPKSIHKQGWGAINNLFLKQDLRVDVKKLRVVLLSTLRVLQ